MGKDTAVSSRREFLRNGALAASGWVCGKAAGASNAGGGRPNVVLCMADDQGWGDVGYNGHPVLKTPHLDALAQTGLRFDRFYAAAPVCSPTRASVLTGRHPNRMGCFQWGYTLRPQEITLAEALSDAGYAAGHFGKWHLGSVRKGSPVNPGASGFDTWLSAPNYYDNDPIMSKEGTAVPVAGESSMVAAEAAIEFMRARAREDRPFLAVVWFGSPHRPHESAPEYAQDYADQPARQQQFLGEMAGLDAAVGRLRAALRDMGVAGNTLFWYCSDNGGLDPEGRTGGRAHKGSIYEGGLRSPAVLEWPARIKEPRQTGIPCSTSDIFPTVLDALGVRRPPKRTLDGVSLLPLIEGHMEKRPKPIGFWDHPVKGRITPSKDWMAELYQAQQAGKEPGDPAKLCLDAGEIGPPRNFGSYPGHSAWLDWPWKFHRIEEEGKAPVFELYHLGDDPGETKDLLEAHPERANLFHTALEAWLISVVRSLNGDDY